MESAVLQHDVARDDEAMGEVSAVLLNLEYTIARSRKGLARACTFGDDPTVEVALTSVIEGSTKQHKRLMHDTYFVADTSRLL